MFYWLPRCVAILFILFLSLFALDVFSGNSSFGVVIVGFLIHLIPSYVLLLALVFAWKREKIGGFLFIPMLSFLAFSLITICMFMYRSAVKQKYV